jgi:hypothetical protein
MNFQTFASVTKLPASKSMTEYTATKKKSQQLHVVFCSRYLNSAQTTEIKMKPGGRGKVCGRNANMSVQDSTDCMEQI